VIDGLELTMAALRAVAAVENDAPSRWPEWLLDEPEGGTRVTFRYVGYRVVVTPDAVEVH